MDFESFINSKKLYLGGFIPHSELINTDLIYQRLIELTEGKIGSIFSFIGVVRESSLLSEKRVKSLVIEYWEKKGDIILTDLLTKVGVKYDLNSIRVLHLFGNLPVNSPIVYVYVSSGHRDNGYVALEKVIDVYKHQIPVWKKEIYADDSGQWIGDSHPPEKGGKI